MVVSGLVLYFEEGKQNISHTIYIKQDHICEMSSDPEDDELFQSVILSASGPGTVDIFNPTALISIEDQSEPECGKLFHCYYYTLVQAQNCM